MRHRRPPGCVASALVLCLLLSGCAVMDPVRWRVRDPAAISLVRATGPFRTGRQVVLPPAEAESTPIEYSYRPPRGQLMPSDYCREGPAPSAVTLSELTGLAILCRGTAMALREPGGAVQLDFGDARQPLVAPDGTVIPLLFGLRREGPDHLGGFFDPPLQDRHDLVLLLVTPRDNLASASRVQRRQPLLGGVLAGLGVASVALGVGILAIGMRSAQDASAFGPALTGIASGASFGFGAGFLSTGSYFLMRPEREVPLR
ncbi:MAG: hypothetical protein U1A78_25030 [Polyangia bacterium]